MRGVLCFRREWNEELTEDEGVGEGSVWRERVGEWVVPCLPWNKGGMTYISNHPSLSTSHIPVLSDHLNAAIHIQAPPQQHIHVHVVAVAMETLTRLMITFVSRALTKFNKKVYIHV